MRVTFFLFFVVASTGLFAQEKFFDAKTQLLLDSLNGRIVNLNHQVKSREMNRDARYFYLKRELEMTQFLREYQELIFDEKLEEAQKLIDNKIKSSEKSSDNFASDFYKTYKSKLNRLRGEKRTHYNFLFEKEKNFRKEYLSYLGPGDEYSLTKTLRMVRLAITYAEEQSFSEALKVLKSYESHTEALILDLHSKYNLLEFTNSQKKFENAFGELLESDSLTALIEAGEMLDQCIAYSSMTETKIGTDYFLKQQITQANAIADLNQKQGISAELAKLTGKSVLAKFDTINSEGLFKWKESIVVIGHLNFNSKSDQVKRGEAIIDADKTLLNFIRINDIANINRGIEFGKTFIISYSSDGKKSDFMYNPDRGEYQYMICYTGIKNKNLIQEMGKVLPPLQFQNENNEDSNE